MVPIVVDDTGVIVAGHGRYAAAQQLRMPVVSVIRAAHLSPTQIRLYALADNRIGELASWDNEKLAIELKELEAIDLHLDLVITGFETPEIDMILDPGGTER